MWRPNSTTKITSNEEYIPSDDQEGDDQISTQKLIPYEGYIPSDDSKDDDQIPPQDSSDVYLTPSEYQDVAEQTPTNSKTLCSELCLL